RHPAIPAQTLASPHFEPEPDARSNTYTRDSTEDSPLPIMPARCSPPLPNSLGVATGINFQPTGGGKAAITGDFVMIAREVNPVIKALRQNGIAVTALHSHML